MPTKITWTEETWNPVTGCHKVSPGCLNCYAERIAQNHFGHKKWTPANIEHNLKLHRNRLSYPKGWKKPRMVFVNSMSDLFHPRIPFKFIEQVFAVMEATPRHTYQILTKRPAIMQEFLQFREPLPNVWLGVSAENDEYIRRRVPILLDTPATVRFVSLEPLLEMPTAIADYMVRLDWIIVGGESGVLGCREMPIAAPAFVRDLCQRHGTPFFFKQWGGWPDKRDGDAAILDGRLWTEYPSSAAPPPEPVQLSLF